jgi:hypothetical protein
VHTTPVSVRFNSTHLTDTVTNLPITAHTPAPSLLDDGDIESQPGPPSRNISPALHFNIVRERERAFQESRQFNPLVYVDDDSYSDSPSFANEPESEYSAASLAPPLTDDVVAELLQHTEPRASAAKARS